MSNQTKKEWQAPSIDVLDVKQTMHGAGGSIIDKNRVNAKHPDEGFPPVDPS